MLRKLLITGGHLRENGYELGEGKYYGRAELLRLDLQTGEIEELISVSEGNENTTDEFPNLEFTVGCVENDKLWLSMDTEIRFYDYENLKLLKTYSHPCFHNIHSVAVRGDKLYATSTGLDMVVVLDKNSGEILDNINADGKPTWFRFSSEIDYRKVHSTRPHDCHPNYVYWIEDKAWVVRCTQGDAVCLEDTKKRLDVSGSNDSISIHDGILYQDKIYFTMVDGSIVVANPYEQKIIETIKLYNMENYGGIRGWCRGLYIEDDLCYVGFSRLRKTKAKGKLAWLSKFANRGNPDVNSSVIVFNLTDRKIVADYKIPNDIIDAIYTVLPEPSNASKSTV